MVNSRLCGGERVSSFEYGIPMVKKDLSPVSLTHGRS